MTKIEEAIEFLKKNDYLIINSKEKREKEARALQARRQHEANVQAAKDLLASNDFEVVGPNCRHGILKTRTCQHCLSQTYYLSQTYQQAACQG